MSRLDGYGKVMIGEISGTLQIWQIERCNQQDMGRLCDGENDAIARFRTGRRPVLSLVIAMFGMVVKFDIGDTRRCRGLFKEVMDPVGRGESQEKQKRNDGGKAEATRNLFPG